MRYSLRSLMGLSLGVALALWVVGVGVLLLFIPMSRENALFACVSNPNKHADTLSSHDLPGKPNGEFLVNNNKLYLKVQGTRSAVVLVTGVSFYDWSSGKLAKFRADHPELEQYYPDRTKPNAGIAWVSE